MTYRRRFVDPLHQRPGHVELFVLGSRYTHKKKKLLAGGDDTCLILGDEAGGLGARSTLKVLATLLTVGNQLFGSDSVKTFSVGGGGGVGTTNEPEHLNTCLPFLPVRRARRCRWRPA